MYVKSDCETKIIQQILYLLYIQKEKKITKEEINTVIKEIINSKDFNYKLLFYTLENGEFLLYQF